MEQNVKKLDNEKNDYIRLNVPKFQLSQSLVFSEQRSTVRKKANRKKANR